MTDRLSLFDQPAPDAPKTDEHEIDSPSPERRRTRRKALIISLAAVLVLLLAAGATVTWYLHRIESALTDIRREEFMPGPGSPGNPQILPGSHGINYVLMGTDTQPGDAGRSDSLMVAHVTANRDKVYLISFPRDLWVDIPGRGKGKINWAYAFGGPELTIRTLDQLIGVRMDHAAVVDFDGFIRLTDALDGVEVFNKRGFRSNHNGGHYFPEGMVNLKGDQALAYVRERYNLPNGDLDRAENQRDVVRAILDEAAQPTVLGNPAAVDGILTQLSGTITVDKGLTNEKIRETAVSMRLRSGRDIVNFQAPMTGFGWAGDQSIAIVNVEQMAELGTALREDRLDDYLARFPCTGPNC